MAVIDVHTHMFTRRWMELLRANAGVYSVQTRPDGQEEIFRGDTPVAIPQRGHFDYELRMRDMDAAKIDMAIVSLTCPNVYWGGEAISGEAARELNHSMAAAQKKWPDRIRWFTSLPWEYPARAAEELKRSCDAGAIGVMVLCNISGRSLTDPFFAPVWQEIDRRALPVLVHPTDLPGIEQMDMRKYDLSWSVGFIADTTLAFARIIFDGFLDLYPNLKLIASHGGGALPYLVGRFDKGDEVEDSVAAPGEGAAFGVYEAHLLRLHHLSPGGAEVSDLDCRGRPGAVRHRLPAPGARHEGRDAEYRDAAG